MQQLLVLIYILLNILLISKIFFFQIYFIFIQYYFRGANLLAVNADGNMPYDICEDEAALDLIESEMARRGVTQQLIDNTRATIEHRMLQELQKAVEINQSYLLESYDHQGATPVRYNIYYLLFINGQFIN